MSCTKDLPEAINFPKEWLPAVWGAILRKEVKWGKDSLIGAAGSTEFEWASARRRYVELFVRPISIRIIFGKPDAQDLTAAVLKGKIATC